MQTLITAVSAAATKPSDVFGAFASLAQTRLELTLFTVMELDHESGLGQRSYTSNPGAYPVGGAKPLVPNRWTAQVIDKKNTFVANCLDDLVDIFPDHALIQSLGCESCLNLPVVVGGEVLGTVNCLGPAGHFTANRIADAEALRPAAMLALLAARHLRMHGAG